MAISDAGIKDSCTTPPTDSSGTASCSIAISSDPGSNQLTVSYAGDEVYNPTSAQQPVTVQREESFFRFPFSGGISLASTVTLSGSLRFDDTGASGFGGFIPGASVGLSITQGATRGCTQTTGSSGFVQCSISTDGFHVGPATETVTFPGNTDFLPSTSSRTVWLFQFPSSGQFVVGDAAANDLGNEVYFYGSQYIARNYPFMGEGQQSFSQQSSPPRPLGGSFYGWAKSTTVDPPSCGAQWNVPERQTKNTLTTVPEYMAVLASSKITSGVSSDGVVDYAGTVVHMYVVHVESYGYSSGSLGEVIAQIC
jgi:hypothetical protein